MTNKNSNNPNHWRVLYKIFFCRYAHWNAYTYNQQANPAAYPYGGTSSTSAPSSGTSSYSPYAENQSNSQYSYAPSNTVNANDYYSQYGYTAPQPAAVYGEANGKLSFFPWTFFFHYTIVF